MKVEVVAEIARLKDGFPQGRGKVCEKGSDIQALADFRAALSGIDSFFYLQDSVVAFSGRPGELHGACVGQVVLVFRRLDLNGNRSLYSLLSQTLQELLKATSSSDALFAKLCLTPPSTEDARASEISLVLQLEAIGSTPEQAEIRWGYGLAHIQKALIAAASLLKLHLAKTGA
jgi:hypothetical protein